MHFDHAGLIMFVSTSSSGDAARNASSTASLRARKLAPPGQADFGTAVYDRRSL